MPLTEESLIAEYMPVHPLPNGLAVYLRRDQIGGETPEHVVVAGHCVLTGEFHAVENVPLLGLSNWYDLRVAIQDALPAVSQADRGFTTGTHPRVFNPAP
jgi:hypothetical protein